MPTSAGQGFSLDSERPAVLQTNYFGDLLLPLFEKFWGAMMEIILALIIGLAVACVTFILGRIFVGSGGAYQSERSMVASVDPDAVTDEVIIVDAAGTSNKTVSSQEAPRKTRKPSATQLKEGAAAPRPRRRKPKKPTAAETEVLQ
jgi:hypothetical protein